MEERETGGCFSSETYRGEYICGYEVRKVCCRKGIKENQANYSKYMKIGRCRRGSGIISSKDGAFLIGVGIYYIILSNLDYMIIAKDEEMDLEFVLIDEEAVAGILYHHNRQMFEKMVGQSPDRIRVFGYLDKPQMGLSIRLLLGELEERHPMYRESALGILMTLAVYMIRDFLELVVEEKNKHQMDEFDYILPSIQYIIDHYQEEIRVATLAKICHVSESYYRLAFREYMHMSPLEYINQFRIEKACKLLVNSSYSVEVISSKVGFRSMTTFYRNFKNQKGCTPYWFRNNDL